MKAKIFLFLILAIPVILKAQTTVGCSTGELPKQGVNLCLYPVTTCSNTSNTIVLTTPQAYIASTTGTFTVHVLYTNPFGAPPTDDCFLYQFSGCTIVNNNAAGNITITLPAGSTLPVGDLDAAFRLRVNIKADGNSAWQYFYHRINSSCDAVLPLTLISFNATRYTSGGYTRVRCQWVTDSESNTSHFLLERSNDNINYNTTVVRYPAAGNSSSQITYTFDDSFPSNITDNLYRLRMVDIDGRFTFSPIRLVRCAGQTVQPVTAINCSNVNITGPGSFCNGPETYGLSLPLLSYCNYNWSANPASVVNINSQWNQAKVSSNNGGTTTLIANLSRCTPATANRTKVIQVGNTLLQVSASEYTDPNCPNGVKIVTVSVINYGANPSTAYTWYISGSNIGTGYTRTFTLNPGQFVNYQVVFNSPCGQQTYSGSAYGNGINPVRYTISPNPANTQLSVQRPRPCGDPVPRMAGKESMPMMAEIYDQQGNLKRRWNDKRNTGKLIIPTHDLPTGNYLLRITENGISETQQIRIEH
jgi:hypothetical protein